MASIWLFDVLNRRENRRSWCFSPDRNVKDYDCRASRFTQCWGHNTDVLRSPSSKTHEQKAIRVLHVLHRGLYHRILLANCAGLGKNDNGGRPWSHGLGKNVFHDGCGKHGLLTVDIEISPFHHSLRYIQGRQLDLPSAGWHH